jgi:hypothetical protein
MKARCQRTGINQINAPCCLSLMRFEYCLSLSANSIHSHLNRHLPIVNKLITIFLSRPAPIWK